MKKLNLILPVVIAFMTLTFAKSYAQIVMNSPLTSSPGEEDKFSKSIGKSSTVVNLKAEKEFKKVYPQTRDAEWFALNDNSLVCRFKMNDITHRAIYTAQGQWKYTTSSYDAGKLNKVIYDKVKSVYYNSNIVFVNQIDLVDGGIIYIVELQDEKSIRKVRVEGDEMEVVQEFIKQ